MSWYRISLIMNSLNVVVFFYIFSPIIWPTHRKRRWYFIFYTIFIEYCKQNKFVLLLQTETHYVVAVTSRILGVTQYTNDFRAYTPSILYLLYSKRYESIRNISIFYPPTTILLSRKRWLVFLLVFLIFLVERRRQRNRKNGHTESESLYITHISAGRCVR